MQVYSTVIIFMTIGLYVAKVKFLQSGPGFHRPLPIQCLRTFYICSKAAENNMDQIKRVCTADRHSLMSVWQCQFVPNFWLSMGDRCFGRIFILKRTTRTEVLNYNLSSNIQNSNHSSIENLKGFLSIVVITVRWVTAKGSNTAEDPPPHTKIRFCAK